MKKTIFLSITGAAVLAAVASCAPRAEGASPMATVAAQPAAAAATTGTVPAASSEELRDRLIAAGLSVPKEPIAADDFELTSLAGGKVKLSAYRGRVVFLNFWATWCPPCRAEMPSMERLRTLLGARGLEIVAVDLQEPKNTVQKFVKENSLAFTVLLDANGAVGGAWGAQSIPTTYLIDRRGSILARSVGSREWDSADMVALFETILAAE
ncbi:MAG: TlpA disulfide reductase family protein [Spirochaetes bacterium]|nr:TlpA disulfide reductase family protein [Spirochaetota bacterium]